MIQHHDLWGLALWPNPVSVGDVIDPTVTERVAAQNSPAGQDRALNGTMYRYRFEAISRTAGKIATDVTVKWGNQLPVRHEKNDYEVPRDIDQEPYRSGTWLSR